jgi:cyclohexa-1,5-dienecarbonyl-CoA hydratase
MKSQRGKVALELTHDGCVARVTLAAPKANILDCPMMLELIRTLRELNWEGRLKLVLLGSEGPHFSFGASVEEHLPDKIARTLVQLRELLRTFMLLPAPTIAVVRGQCLGGGLELALACDLIIAEESAQFALPEIKLGVFPPAGAALLPVRIGASRAAEMVLTGASWNGSDAKAAGLVHRAAPDGELDTAVEKWLAADFLPRSAAALYFAAQASRRAVLRALDHDLPFIEELYLNRLMKQPEALEGLQAFLEKRQPNWAKGTAA